MNNKTIKKKKTGASKKWLNFEGGSIVTWHLCSSEFSI
jgi:hypothetical protein